MFTVRPWECLRRCHVFCSFIFFTSTTHNYGLLFKFFFSFSLTSSHIPRTLKYFHPIRTFLVHKTCYNIHMFVGNIIGERKAVPHITMALLFNKTHLKEAIINISWCSADHKLYAHIYALLSLRSSEGNLNHSRLPLGNGLSILKRNWIKIPSSNMMVQKQLKNKISCS